MNKLKKFQLVLLIIVFVTAQLLPQTTAFATASPGSTKAFVVEDGKSKEELANTLLGSGVTVSNIRFQGTTTSAGTFSGGGSIFGLDSGIILSTGKAVGVLGPNNLDLVTSTEYVAAGDEDLDGLVTDGTFDATALEFDFIPTTNNITFTYCFASEEYNFTFGEYNDVFALYVNGVNMALVPGTNDLVSVTSINSDKNSQYFNNNMVTPFPYYTTMNGFTKEMKVSAPVNANQVNHIKLVIADSYDDEIDSNILISALSATPPEDIYKVTTEAVNGTVTGAGDYTEDEIVVLNAKPAAGYEFIGWESDDIIIADPLDPSLSFSMPAEDVHVKAKFAKPSFSLSYDGNGSTSGVVPAKADYETASTVNVSSKGNLERKGYTFTGWNTAANGSGTAYPAGGTLTMPAKDITLYAQWELNNHKMMYDGNGSTGGEAPAVPTNYDFDKSVSVLGNSNVQPYEKTGYTFTGWNTKADGSGAAYTGSGTETFKMPDKDVTLYAQWKINQHEVKYDGNGNTGGIAPAAPETYDVNETVTVLGNSNPAPYEKSGFTFTGWNTKADGTGEAYTGSSEETFKMPDKNVTLYAQWKMDKRVVTYDGNGSTSGVAPAEATICDLNETVTVLGNTNVMPYEKTGYTFTGWNTNADGTGEAYAGTGEETFKMPDKNVTLYAQWKPNQHEVKYDGNGSSGGVAPTLPKTYNFDETVAVLGNKGETLYEKTGYTFTGWNTKADGTGEAYTGTGAETFKMPDKNVTLYAQWELNQYEVKYDGNGSTAGVGPAEATAYDVDEIVTVLGNTSENPYEKTGYTFTGWNTKADGTGISYTKSGTETFNMPTEDVTLYAQWGVMPKPIATPQVNSPKANSPKTGNSMNGQSLALFSLLTAGIFIVLLRRKDVKSS